MGAEHDPLVGAARHVEQQRLGLGRRFLGLDRQGHPRPVGAGAGEPRRRLRRDAGGRDAVGAVASRGSGDDRARHRTRDQKADRARLTRHQILAAPVDRASREHQLVAHQRDPAGKLRTMHLEFLRSAAPEIHHLGRNPARRSRHRAHQRMARDLAAVGKHQPRIAGAPAAIGHRHAPTAHAARQLATFAHKGERACLALGSRQPPAKVAQRLELAPKLRVRREASADVVRKHHGERTCLVGRVARRASIEIAYCILRKPGRILRHRGH
jgi:hypothetical protein